MQCWRLTKKPIEQLSQYPFSWHDQNSINKIFNVEQGREILLWTGFNQYEKIRRQTCFYKKINKLQLDVTGSKVSIL